MSNGTPAKKKLAPETGPGWFLATGWGAGGGALGGLVGIPLGPPGMVIGTCIGVILGYLAAVAVEDLILHPPKLQPVHPPVELGIDPKGTSGLKFEPDEENPTKIVIPAGGPYIGPTAKVNGRPVNVVYE